MNVKLTKMMPLLFSGAAAVAFAVAPVAGAQPAPPPCLNADGTPCAVTGNIDASPGGGADVNVPGGPQGTADGGGASGVIPGGPGGTAGPGGASGSLAPNGPGGTAGPGGASGCLPNVGCINIPAP
ncbi:hypothetical protein A5790_05005 [Mycobacterium sp. 852002-51152_SCH6134967]|uniref:hypothetical protein n=1 Tax=Mycobacterium TaxID=1763 RepID=UPI0007FF4E5E|nr:MULTISPECIES: hypothetical protein [Mycobacterium]OBF96397.1 hypothetical protein A5790_05005 [Mycobacterium sp. 852002-51152_SCH6134967]